SDGLGYYAWLRSALIDHDWSFDNEFDEHNPLENGVQARGARTSLGLRANPFSIGPACFWALSVVPSHLLIQSFQVHGFPWAADGYSLPYQLLVGGTTLLASFLGFVLMYSVCRRFVRFERAALAAASLTLGTPISYYSAVEPSMGHALGTVAV